MSKEEEMETWLGVLAKLDLGLRLLPKLMGFVHSHIWLPSRTKSRERETGQHVWALDLRGGFPGGSAGKESACNAGDLGLIPGSGRSPGEGKIYPLQYSGLENPMDKGYSPWSHKELDTNERITLFL